MADRKSSKPKKPKTARWQRIAMMDKEILDVEGAATLLGVSTTIYNLARKLHALKKCRNQNFTWSGC